jgi:DNA-binding transcriptional ArsR family regulator
MAVLRGRTIATNRSRERLEQLRQLMSRLIATSAKEKRSLEAFLDEAGGVELSELGAVFSRVDAARRSRIADRFINFLADPDWNRRDSAARVLGSMGARKAIPALRQLVFQPGGEGVSRLAALRALDQLGGLESTEVSMLRLDPSAVVRDEADRLMRDREARKSPSNQPVAFSSLLQIKGHPTAILDNLIERNILLSLSQREQPVGELANLIGKSAKAVRHHLALLQCKTEPRKSLQDAKIPLVAPRKMGKATVYVLTGKGRSFTRSLDRRYADFLNKILSSLPLEKQP